MKTGYMAREPGVGRCWSKVHIFDFGKGLCGYKPSPSMSFQWCANGIELRYVECDKCRQAANKIYTEITKKCS